VKNGGGATVPCGTCHGAVLRGAGAFRASRAARQATSSDSCTTSSPARAAASSALMKPIVEKVTGDDMIALAAYLASLR
jgi:cytochrome c553